MKHTPGPWTNSGGTIESIDGWHVASAHGNGGDQLANAMIIAAAPELLETLEHMRNSPEFVRFFPATQELVIETIAKAKKTKSRGCEK